MGRLFVICMEISQRRGGREGEEKGMSFAIYLHEANRKGKVKGREGMVICRFLYKLHKKETQGMEVSSLFLYDLQKERGREVQSSVIFPKRERGEGWEVHLLLSENMR